MCVRRHFSNRPNLFLLMTGAMWFGITATFSPSLHGANIERMGMIESADHGATWHFKGHADFHAPGLNPVDPSALSDKGLLAFYFFDLMSLGADTAVAYRSVATDGEGLDFSIPAPAFKFAGDFTDPFVLKLPDGRYRMYLQSQSPDAILSATSENGFVFTQDAGERTRAGGLPGAIVLSDGRIRLYVSTSEGTLSLISDDGYSFAPEPGIRVPGGGAPSPIRCADGVYRMSYSVRPAGQGENPELDEVHLAESTDGFTWTSETASLVTGSVPTLVELPDGRLRIYYVDFQPDEPAGIFKFIKTVQVTPDADFQSAGFARVGYVPANNNLAVTFGGSFKHTMNTLDGGYAYKEYTLDMHPTGKSGALYGAGADIGGLMVGNVFYAANMDPSGWHIVKFDAVSWEKAVDIKFALDTLSEGIGDMMLAFVNGQLDVSSQTLIAGKISSPEIGAGTHHHFFTPDLDFLGKKILSDTPHITGSAMIYADSVYYFVSATAYTGDVIVMKYDSDWKYLGSKKLVSQGHWSEGLAYDGRCFYIAYLDTRQRTETTFFPYYPNVHLAAFDRDWNLLEDAAVTDFTPSDSIFTGRPSLLLHGNRVYVSYDAVPLPEDLSKIEGYVSVYEITQNSSGVRRREESPGDFRLEPNYPNPFNPSTTIRFDLPKSAFVRLSVCNLMGQEIAVLVNEKRPAGVHEVRWEGLDARQAPVPSGVYLYRLEAGPDRGTGKLLLLK
jgi:hypothetical protein